MIPGILATGHPSSITAAEPYPWPFHGRLDPARSALVTCLDGRWRSGLPGDDECDLRLTRLAAAVRTSGGLVVATTATTSPPRRRCSRAPSGHRKLLSGLDPHVVVETIGSSAFFSTTLDDQLRFRGYSDLLLAGWGLEGPVHSTMRSANDRGYECLLVVDASTSVEPSLTFAACEMIRFSGGIFGAFATTADVLSAYEGGRTGRNAECCSPTM